MKPCSRRVLQSTSLLQNISIGSVVTHVAGSVKKLGHAYRDATIVLYRKNNLQPIAVTRPDKNGDYRFLGLNTNLKTFIVAFDKNQQFNAFIQDNVVPK